MTRRDDRYRVGVDIGGTFTDFVLVDGETGRVRLYKCLTTPKDPSAGALEGLEELLRAAGLGFSDLGTLVHGTTLVTNAIIERSGSSLGLLTTRGFRDILEMGTEQRYDIYDLFLRFPDPLAPRAFRREIDERLDRDGRVVVPLDLTQAHREVADLVSNGVEALAVCFLHAYRNPVHERAIAEMVRREFPGLAVSLSCEVVPELREYERSATTAANAYVQPLMARYVAKLEGALAERGFAGRFYLIQSSGGMTSPAAARRFPIRLLESGPAGGALVTAFFGRQVGQDDVIAFDMGGTTAKACLVQGGRPDVAPAMEAARVHRFKRGSGLPIKAPVIDMIEIGAGGGSIARVDALGLLKVGPRSAGADPGPACYGLGGKEPTVTDANLLLGYLDPGFFLGGRMRLERPPAEVAVAALAGQLGLDPIQTAWGVYEIVCENMAAAARVHIVEKGRDPRRYAMVAFGGAGPAHAARVARILGIGEVIVPPASGAAAALGFLVAPISFEFVTSLPGVLRRARSRDGQSPPRRPRGAGAHAPHGGRGGGRRRHRHAARRDAPPRSGPRHRRAAPGGSPPARGPPGHRDRLRCRVRAPLHPRVHGDRHPGDQLARPHRRAGSHGGRRRSGRCGVGSGRAEGRPSRVLSGIRGLRPDTGVRPVRPGPGPSPDGPRHRRGARVHDGRAAGRPARGGSAGQPPHPRRPHHLARARRAGGPRPRPGGRADRIRPGGARDHVEPPHQHRRGVLAHRLADGLLPHHRRGAGLRLRAPGPPRQLARALAAGDAGLQPHASPGGPGDPGAVPGRDARPRRHPDHQRSVDLRRAPLRRRHRDAGLPGRPGRRHPRHDRPRDGHRRYPGQPERARDLRGGLPDPPDEALSRGGAERGPLPAPGRKRPQERASAGGPPRPDLGQRLGRPATPGVHGRVRAGRPRSPGHGDPGPLGASDAGRHPRGAGRDLPRARSGTTAWARRSATRSRSPSRETGSRSTSPARRPSSPGAGRTALTTTRRRTPCTRSSASCPRPCRATPAAIAPSP